MTTGHRGFEIICEVSSPRKPDLTAPRSQVRALAPVASAFLVPENHLGRAAVSSLTVAQEVQRLGGPAIACLNSRDRNLLGLHRDLLTAAACGIDRLVCVRGDEPTAGTRAGGLTVARMIEEIRACGTSQQFSSARPFTVGAAAQLGPVPGWKRDADFLLTQVSFSPTDQLRWRDTADLRCPVYAGIMVLHKPQLAAVLPGAGIPASLAERVARDPGAGIAHACEQISAVREHGGFAGVHLITLRQHQRVAARLSEVLAGRQLAAT